MAWKWWKFRLLFGFRHNRFCCYTKFSLGLNPGLGLVPRVIIDTVLCAPAKHANSPTNCVAGIARKSGLCDITFGENYLEMENLGKQKPAIGQPANHGSGHRTEARRTPLALLPRSSAASGVADIGPHQQQHQTNT